MLFFQITCPGVLLKDKSELYLSACVFGQYKRTQFYFLTYEKTFFSFLVDTAVLELIQLVPPVGEILATYEENTRDFLFPDPKLTRGHHGSDREVLMKRSFTFTVSAYLCIDNLDRVHHSTPNGRLQTRSPKKNTPSPEKNRHCLATKNYEQPTIASKSRSPSPYTKRRMCELSEEARQRLAHLNLGPFEFRRETDKPPFVIRHVCILCKVFPFNLRSNIIILLNITPQILMISFHHEKDLDGSSDSCDEHPISGTASRQFRSTSSLIRSAPASLQKHSSSPVLSRSSLRERFNTGWSTPANGEEIHKRVKTILRTHSARQSTDFSCLSTCACNIAEAEQSILYAISAYCSTDSSAQQNTTVHLDNGEYWSNRAAVYKGKPHRAIFEDSLEKIYRNMYKKACGTISKRKIHS
uniref:Spermatogenesis-associated protein 6 N-terminal domain-containing protein n=1 Tax=Chelydra serpentina TaxID=8475 RepID=A0A8C3RW54_CHESE